MSPFRVPEDDPFAAYIFQLFNTAVHTNNLTMIRSDTYFIFESRKNAKHTWHIMQVPQYVFQKRKKDTSLVGISCIQKVAYTISF